VWDLVEWLERCASIPQITSSNPNSGSELTFRSDLLLTARGGCTWALIEFACLPCYPGNTLCSQRLEPGWVGATRIPKFIFFFLNLSLTVRVWTRHTCWHPTVHQHHPTHPNPDISMPLPHCDRVTLMCLLVCISWVSLCASVFVPYWDVAQCLSRL
jgi:hypothetical protein